MMMTETQKIAFKKNVKKLMIEYDMTQRELARELGIGESMLTHAINGTKKPPFDMVVSLANYFGVRVDDLIKEA
jgi:transcriptional regulator with XRE-family HTH domain